MKRKVSIENALIFRKSSNTNRQGNIRFPEKLSTTRSVSLIIRRSRNMSRGLFISLILSFDLESIANEETAAVNI